MNLTIRRWSNRALGRKFQCFHEGAYRCLSQTIYQALALAAAFAFAFARAASLFAATCIMASGLKLRAHFCNNLASRLRFLLISRVTSSFSWLKDFRRDSKSLISFCAASVSAARESTMLCGSVLPACTHKSSTKTANKIRPEDTPAI